jgi:hypothetical protein
MSAAMSNSAAPHRNFRTDLHSLPRRASGRTWRQIADCYVRNQAPAKVYLHLSARPKRVFDTEPSGRRQKWGAA